MPEINSNIKTQQIFRDVMTIDLVGASRAVQCDDVATVSDIDAMFDGISYSKGNGPIKFELPANVCQSIYQLIAARSGPDENGAQFSRREYLSPRPD